MWRFLVQNCLFNNVNINFSDNINFNDIRIYNTKGSNIECSESNLEFSNSIFENNTLVSSFNSKVFFNDIDISNISQITEEAGSDINFKNSPKLTINKI